MNRALPWLALAALAVPAHAGSAPEAELRAISQELLDAIAPGKVEVWARYLDEGLIHVDETGEVTGKSELLAQLAPLPPGLVGRIEIASFKFQRDDAGRITGFVDRREGEDIRWTRLPP